MTRSFELLEDRENLPEPWVEAVMKLKLEKKAIDAFLTALHKEVLKTFDESNETFPEAYIRVHVTGAFAKNPPKLSNDLLYRLKYMSMMYPQSFAETLYSSINALCVLKEMNKKQKKALTMAEIANDSVLSDQQVALGLKLDNDVIARIRHSTNDYKKLREVEDFRDALADHIGFFRNPEDNSLLPEEPDEVIKLNESNPVSCVYEFVKFGEFLKKKFSGYSPQEIRRELEDSAREHKFKNQERFSLTSFLLAEKAYANLLHEANKTKEAVAVLNDMKSGLDGFITLLGPRAEEMLRTNAAAALTPQKTQLLVQVTSYIKEDLIPNTAMRHALDASLEHIEHYGKEKKAHKDNTKGDAAFELTDGVRTASEDYFRCQAKTPELKMKFKEACYGRISEANLSIGRHKSALWKRLMKGLLIIVGTIATAGLLLAGDALYSSIKTGKIGKSGLFGTETRGLRLAMKMKDRVDSIVPEKLTDLMDSVAVERSRAKKPK